MEMAKKSKPENFRKKASLRERLLHAATRELKRKTKETTTQNIASAFEKATARAEKVNELTNLLTNLEEHGLIKTDITDIDVQPKLVWKP